MIFGMYSIRDSLTGFMTPVLEQNDASALRNFRMACDSYPQESGRSVMRWKPSDFSFFKIADFDSESGEITPIVPPRFISSGLSHADAKEVDD